VKEEVDVRVDESRHEGERAEVEDAGSGGMRDGGPDGGDVVALDEDFAGRDEGAFFDIEQVRGVEDDKRTSGWGCSLSEKRERQESRCEKGSKK
jgi:hypothetical protein